MASGADNLDLVASPPKCETDPAKTQLLEDLSARLQLLQEKVELCNEILTDLVGLRDAIAKKQQSDAMFTAP